MEVVAVASHGRGHGRRDGRDVTAVVSLAVVLANTVAMAMAMAVTLGTQWPWMCVWVSPTQPAGGPFQCMGASERQWAMTM